MKSIDILVRVNGVEDFLVIYMFGQRELHKNAVNLRIVVVFVDQGQQIFFGNILRLIVLDFIETKVECSLDLQRHIADRCGVFTDENGDQAGNLACLLFHLSHFLLDFLKNCFADFSTADKFCRHGVSPPLTGLGDDSMTTDNPE